MPRIKIICIVALSVCVFYLPCIARAADPSPLAAESARKSEVSIWQNGIGSKTVFQTFEDLYLHGAFLASGDVNGDGKDEVIVGSGPARKNEVRIYTTEGKLMKSFRPFVDEYQGGVRVAVGDVSGDKRAEIVVAPNASLRPIIGIYNEKGEKLKEGLAFDERFRGGVRIAVGDLDRDGKREIVAASGPGGGPHVRLFDADLQNKGMDLFAYDASMTDGVSVAIVKTSWGDQLIASAEGGMAPLIRRYSFDQNGGRLDKEFYAFDSSSLAGVSVAGYDYDGDGIDEIVAWRNNAMFPEVRFFDVYGTLYRKFLLVDPTYRGSLSIASVQADTDPAKELAVVTVSPFFGDALHAAKSIIVSVTDQMLYAYENGKLVKSFLVSTGVKKYSTPLMETYVQEKIPVKRYKWSYGPGHPDNYDLPNVKWNLRIYGPVFIHGAYWHNNFGHRMSHGCVNVHYTNAEWIFNWADVGTKVSVQE